jgi:hypothetical protein
MSGSENTVKRRERKKRGNTTSGGSKGDPQETVPTPAIELDEKGEMIGWPEHARGTPEWTAKVRSKYNSKSTPWSMQERPLKLKYKQTVVYQEKYGLTNKEAAKRLKISESTWGQVRRHPETKELIKLVQEWGDDTERVIKDMMHSEAVHSFENLMFCRDRLLEKGDYADAAKLDLKILEGIGFWQKAKESNLNVEAQQITISVSGVNLPTGSILDETPKLPEAEYEILPDVDRTTE